MAIICAFAGLIAHAQEVVLYDHPLQMDLTARIKEANAQGKPPLDIHVLPRDKPLAQAAEFADCRAEARDERPCPGGDREPRESL
ncbi:formate dehydrogenase accessory protein FdhE [Leclercia adecarboxylata]|uniref:Formate dehydrogenase accessory protein FdhE n=1 Tax=Leclercia adecarboxylata TaxID=83655 RepID=A0A4U9IXD0_9ENTR|nr:formate dehydrogenase accessory protein FdhE [Leclercia adecarboxylata]